MKYFTLILLCILAFHVSNSQAKFGFSANGVLPKDIHNGPYSHEKVSYAASIFGQINLRSRWLLQPELQFSPERFDYPTAGPEPVVHTFDNLHLPVLIGFSPAKKLTLLIGPEIKFVCKATSVIGKGYKSDITHYSNRWRQAAVININVGLSRHLDVTGRYKYNFSKTDSEAYYFKYGEFQTGLFYVL